MNRTAETSYGGPAQTEGLRAADTVIVVEDERIILQTICEVLSEEGWRILAAPSGEEMAARLPELEGPPLALIVDVKLGAGMSGFDLARLARETWTDLPVIFVSGDLRPLVRQSGPKDLCLMKPFTATALVRLVRGV